MEQLIEPDRVLRFRVCWEDDNRQVQINRGWRIQHQNILGPYKGGIRFAQNVNESILQSLAFEQSFKNALTDLPIGGAKGGANFNPKNKTVNEIRRFCWAYIEEMRKYIGRHIDIPAGDIGVGTREIGFMYGHYLKLEDKFTGVLTGKGTDFGGSCGRKQATGYGCIYFLQEMLKTQDTGLKNKKLVISGAGNVALHTSEKGLQEQAKILTLSDSGGFIYFKNGLTIEQLEDIKKLKWEQYGTLEQWASDKKEVQYYDKQKPWGVPGDIAIPCATQNEINEKDMKQLLDHQIIALCEGANMPLTKEAQQIREKHPNLLYGPRKAANAGGVAVSVLEQSQNAQHISWPLQKVDKVLQTIMKKIHQRCVEFGKTKKGINYKKGANICAFKKLAEALSNYGMK